MFHIAHLRASFDQRFHCLGRALDGLRNLIDILRLDHGLKVIFQNLGEIVYLQVTDKITNETKGPVEEKVRRLLCNSDPLKYLRISSQSGGSSYRPKFGFSLPLRILRAVLFPIPFVPTNPKTWPGRGIGSR